MITIEVKNAQAAMDLKAQLQSLGLVVNQDFTWRYESGMYDGFSHPRSPQVTFWFRDSVQETFFGLKWQ